MRVEQVQQTDVPCTQTASAGFHRQQFWFYNLHTQMRQLLRI